MQTQDISREEDLRLYSFWGPNQLAPYNDPAAVENPGTFGVGRYDVGHGAVSDMGSSHHERQSDYSLSTFSGPDDVGALGVGVGIAFNMEF